MHVMNKYEWTKRQIEEVTKDYPPTNRKYMDAFLAKVKKAGQSLTRVKFFEIYEACCPPDDVEFDYFDYTVLEDHWPAADFSEAWDLPEVVPLPRITTTAKFGKQTLPQDFCSLGGTPDWIQNERYPICSECDSDMVLFLQLKSLPHEMIEKNQGLGAFMFGDAGNFYLFQCPKCGTHKTSWECH
jgi:hypothetical protein